MKQRECYPEELVKQPIPLDVKLTNLRLLKEVTQLPKLPSGVFVTKPKEKPLTFEDSLNNR